MQTATDFSIPGYVGEPEAHKSDVAFFDCPQDELGLFIHAGHLPTATPSCASGAAAGRRDVRPIGQIRSTPCLQCDSQVRRLTDQGDLRGNVELILRTCHEALLPRVRTSSRSRRWP